MKGFVGKNETLEMVVEEHRLMEGCKECGH